MHDADSSDRAERGGPREFAASGWVTLAAVVSIAVGTVLRFSRLGRWSFWVDEAYSAFVASQTPTALLTGHVGDAHTPPAYYVLLHAWMSLTTSDVGLRAFSALFSSIGLVVFWRLLLAVEPRAGWRTTTLALLCFSPYHVYYAQEARMYSLASLLAMVLVVLEMRRARGDGSMAACALVGVGALSLYTHYYLAFVLAGAAVFRLLRLQRRTERCDSAWRVVIDHGAMGLMFVPWIGVVLRLAASGGQQFRQYLGSTVPYSFFRFDVGYAVLPITVEFKRDPVHFALAAWPWVVGVAVATAVPLLALVARLERRERVAPIDDWTALLVAVVATCYAVPLAISIRIPFFAERYVGIVQPLVLLLFVRSVANLELAWIGRLWVTLVAVLGIGGTAAWFLGTSGGKADWRGATLEIEHRAEPGDRVIIDRDYAWQIMKRYLRRTDLVLSPLDEHSPVSKVVTCSSDSVTPTRTWVVLGYSTHTPDDYRHAFGSCARQVYERLYPEEVGVTVLLFERRDGASMTTGCAMSASARGGSPGPSHEARAEP